MSAGKGSAPRNCFSARFRENYDIIFAKKNPDADITIEIERIIREEPDNDERRSKLLGLSFTKAGRMLQRMNESKSTRTVPPHPEL